MYISHTSFYILQSFYDFASNNKVYVRAKIEAIKN